MAKGQPFKTLIPVLEDRRARATKYHQQTEEAIAEFMQLDFKDQLRDYNKEVERVNKAIYRLKKQGADVTSFGDLAAAPELMTEAGRFRKMPGVIQGKYEAADATAQKRAEDLLLKNFEKLKTISEGVSGTEYKKRVAEKAQIEKALGLDEPITWKQYNATRHVKTRLTSADYYSLIQYAEEVGYLDDLSRENQPKLKKKEYSSFLKEVNEWLLEQEGTLPSNAITSMKELKKRALQDAIDRPKYIGSKYESAKRKHVVNKRGSKNLGL